MTNKGTGWDPDTWWWQILCGSLSGSQGRHFFWVCLWGHFRMRLGWVMQLLSPVCVSLMQSVEGPNRTKRWRRGQLPLSARLFELVRHSETRTCIVSAPGPQTLRLSHHQLSWVSGLQQRIWGFPASAIMWANSLSSIIRNLSLSPFIYLSLSYWFSDLCTHSKVKAPGGKAWRSEFGGSWFLVSGDKLTRKIKYFWDTKFILRGALWGLQIEVNFKAEYHLF